MKWKRFGAALISLFGSSVVSAVLYSLRNWPMFGLADIPLFWHIALFLIAVTVGTVGATAAWRIVEDHWHFRVGNDALSDLQKRMTDAQVKINNLESSLRDERREREVEREQGSQRIIALEYQVSTLTELLNKTTRQLGVVEDQARRLTEENARLRSQLPRLRELRPDTPLLHICAGSDRDPANSDADRFCRQDRTKIHRAGVPYRALDNATKKDVEDEMQRRRADGTMYWWIVVSAHGRKEGTELADGIAEPYWWNRTIDGDAHMVIFANCEGLEVGDAVAGIARRVVVMYGDIPSDDASDFVMALLRANMSGMDPDAAYEQARRQVPSIAHYTDIRRS